MLPKNQNSRNKTDVANKIKISIVFLLRLQVRLNQFYRQSNASMDVAYDTDMANMYELRFSMLTLHFH
jgi:hypothetical protein